jgi:hypothetical protein
MVRLTEYGSYRSGENNMKKCYRFAVLILLIGSSMVLTASSQEQVAQTVYVHEGDLNGTMVSGVQVTGQDAAGNSFEGITDSNGIVVLSGQPGTWQFTFAKEGYDSLSLSYDVTESGEGAVYLQGTAKSQEYATSPQTYQQSSSQFVPQSTQLNPYSSSAES